MMLQYTPAAFNSNTPTALWNMLPGRIRYPLLLAGTGDQYVFNQFEVAAEEMAKPGSSCPPEFRYILNDMAVHLWELDPLSANAASLVLLLHEQQPFLPKVLLPLCKLCRSLKPGDARAVTKLKQHFLNGDFHEAKDLLERMFSVEKNNFFWMHYATTIGLRLGELDWYGKWLDRVALPGFLGAGARADYLFARNDWSEAARLYQEIFDGTGLTEYLVRLGECLKRAGQREAALECWRKAFARRPWQINLLLRLSDVMRGNDLPGEQPSGKGLVLLYSWNHGAALDKAIESLAGSELGDAAIIALDNGSTDETPGVLSAWQDRLGGRLDTITLPTNVGAPAARNWLLRTDAAKSADWVVFLDDDAIVPSDWLRYFGKALTVYPEAGIVGCRIVEQASPMTLQSVDLNFAAAVGEDGKLLNTAPFQLVESHQIAADFGQFSYMRPATSVTGCCHLFTRAGIDAVGLFDLRYSPSQFDDIERDMRSELLGQLCVYQGHLRVSHIKRSGSLIKMSNWQVANAEGNLRKLQVSYPGGKIADISRQSLVRLQNDLEQRLQSLM